MEEWRQMNSLGVPGAGIEPACPLAQARHFKCLVSTSFTTRAMDSYSGHVKKFLSGIERAHSKLAWRLGDTCFCRDRSV